MMNDTSNTEPTLPDRIAAIKKRGFVIWATEDLSPDFVGRFAEKLIPVAGIRHVRVWGIQVDDERELMGHERTGIPDEELWEIQLKAKNGSIYEVNSSLLAPAPE